MKKGELIDKVSEKTIQMKAIASEKTTLIKNSASIQTEKIKSKASKQTAKLKNDANEKYTFFSYIILFFVFSFIGWFWEVILHLVQNGVLVNRGVLFGPWLPIYGTGGVVILLFLKKLYNKPVTMFFVNMIVCSIIEYFTSWYLEVTKGLRWWDYSGYLFNLNGRICLEGAIIFGLGGCAIFYLVAPKLNRYIKRIPVILQTTLCIVLISLFVLDNVYSHQHPNTGSGVTNYTKWEKQIKK